MYFSLVFLSLYILLTSWHLKVFECAMKWIYDETLGMLISEEAFWTLSTTIGWRRETLEMIGCFFAFYVHNKWKQIWPLPFVYLMLTDTQQDFLYKL